MTKSGQYTVTRHRRQAPDYDRRSRAPPPRLFVTFSAFVRIVRVYSYQVGFGKASEHAIPASKRGSLRPFWMRISTSPTVTM